MRGRDLGDGVTRGALGAGGGGLDWSRSMVGAAAGLVSLVASCLCFYGAFYLFISSISFFGEPSSVAPGLAFGGIAAVFVATPFVLALPGLALGAGWLRSVGAGVLAGVVFLIFLFRAFAPVAGTTVSEGYLMPLMFVALPTLLSLAVLPGRTASAARSVAAILACAAAIYAVAAGMYAANLRVPIPLLNAYGGGVAAVSWAFLPAIAGAMTRNAASGR